MNIDPFWNCTDREKPKYWEKTLLIASLYTKNPALTGLYWKIAILATNHLSYDFANITGIADVGSKFYL
jgi:hypothetical protein